MVYQEIDPPRLPDVDTSSLGLGWPPNQDGSFNRVRGAWPRLLTVTDLLTSRKELFSVISNSLDAGKRCVIKAVAPADDIVPIINHNHATVEAAIPFRWRNHSYYFLYLGKNPDGRENQAPVSASRIAEYLYRKDKQETIKYTGAGELVRYMIGQGFAPKKADLSDLPALGRLYTAFGWNEEEVGQMLASQHNHVLIAYYQGRALGTVMIEKDIWPVIGAGNLRIAELTEAVVDPDWRRNGIIHGLTALACRLALNTNDLIYGEYNVITTGLLPWRLGMVGTPDNLKTEGILRAHVPIVDGTGDQLSCFCPAAIDRIRAGFNGYFSSEMDEIINHYGLSI